MHHFKSNMIHFARLVTFRCAGNTKCYFPISKRSARVFDKLELVKWVAG
jgi:hypothetical protein